jgi:8-oxo-dGTP pyrophosphatase MutT (NUDIX family)
MKRYIYKIAIWPVKLYWFIFRPQSYGVKCIIKKDGKILMIRNTYGKGWWNFPGGGIKKNENPEDAIVREVREELSVGVYGLKKIGEFLSTQEYKRDNVYVFYAEMNGSEITIDRNEVRDYKWVDPNALPTPISRVALKAIDLWKSSPAN